MSGDEPGRVVPVYALTGGRTRSGSADLPIDTMVTLADGIASRGRLQLEHRAILDLAVQAVSLVEVGAHLRVPVGVARVLVGDLAEAGYLDVHRPPPTSPDGRPSPELLTRLLEGLRAR